jgi:hypothetical protein
MGAPGECDVLSNARPLKRGPHNSLLLDPTGDQGFGATLRHDKCRNQKQCRHLLDISAEVVGFAPARQSEFNATMVRFTESRAWIAELEDGNHEVTLKGWPIGITAFGITHNGSGYICVDGKPVPYERTIGSGFEFAYLQQEWRFAIGHHAGMVKQGMMAGVPIWDLWVDGRHIGHTSMDQRGRVQNRCPGHDRDSVLNRCRDTGHRACYSAVGASCTLENFAPGHSLHLETRPLIDGLIQRSLVRGLTAGGRSGSALASCGRDGLLRAALCARREEAPGT